MRRSCLALLCVCVCLFAAKARAGEVYNFAGASWGPTNPFAPMDLAAAVSNANANIPGSANYLVQFDNYGEHVFNKRTGLNTATVTQLGFWCTGSNLAGCSTTPGRQPFDPQISYNANAGR